ncbi:AAA family ATPase [Kovacikia minuta CCNUW1]|uniref:P-loop NTPase fold protein n=1 Tax=Kovacikia minuta TaxID=2931930 RepID=UPI001CCFC0A6|nr:P-loop NTPase fold protein [Kovacikia minuta]UBF25367.1 AAA family ATPase [Kovacikia minuta CCNUW1]
MDQALLSRLQQAYRDLDLFPLITAEEIDKFRVEYGTEVLIRLKRETEAATKDGKLVFAGHRGCGKSTLLKRFSIEMQPHHFTVFFSISDMIEMSDVNHVNILYAIALMLLSKATQAQVEIPPATQKSLLEWFTTTKSTTASKDLKSELAAGGNFFQVLTAKLKQEETFREEIKTTYQYRISELVDKINQIAALIQTAVKKPVLVIIDDLDKLDLALVESIYLKNIKSLFAPGFRIVFTIPISAIREPALIGVLNSEGVVRVQQFPVAKFFSKEDCRTDNAPPIEKTVNVFLEVLKKRVPSDLIEPETAQQIVLKSGGVMRELVRMARECCTESMVLLESEPERQSIKIDDGILTLALRNLRNDFARPLGTKFYSMLVEVYQTQATADTESKEFLDLLHGLYVLEYLNDDLWYDVHPIVADLLKRKHLIQ